MPVHSHDLLNVFISETIQDRNCGTSRGTRTMPFAMTLSDLDPDFKSPHYYLTVNISETVHDRDLVAMEY